MPHLRLNRRDFLGSAAAAATANTYAAAVPTVVEWPSHDADARTSANALAPPHPHRPPPPEWAALHRCSAYWRAACVTKCCGCSRHRGARSSGAPAVHRRRGGRGRLCRAGYRASLRLK